MSEEQQSKSITIKTKILSWFERNIIAITIISASITILFLFAGYAINGRLCGGDFDNDYLGALGDFLGGFLGSIFGIITIYLVYKTYISQKEELELSRKLIQKQNFESTFFSLLENLNTARNNAVVLNQKKDNNGNYLYTEEFRGVNFFKDQELNIMGNNFLNGFKDESDPFGINTNDDLMKIFFEKNPKFKEQYFKETEYKDLVYNERERIKLLTSYYFYFQKQSQYLEHYFQSILTILEFIDNNDIEKKEFYIKALQSQFSNSELFHIYHYSLLSEKFQNLIVKYGILSRLNQQEILSKEVHEKYYSTKIKLSEKPSIFE